MADTIRITDDTPRCEIELAITHTLATMRREPVAYRERRWAQIDALLEDWVAANG